MFLPRGPPNRPAGVAEQQIAQSSSTVTHPQTPRRSEVQTQRPTEFAQGPPVATNTGDRAPQPRTQANQTAWGQMQQMPHAQTRQQPHAQMPQVPHAQMPQVPHAQMQQVPHAQMPQVLHAQMPQVPHAQAHQLPQGQMHQVPHAQTSQPTQVQMPRATEGGTSSHDQQRSADRRRRNDRIPAVTASRRTTAG